MGSMVRRTPRFHPTARRSRRGGGKARQHSPSPHKQGKSCSGSSGTGGGSMPGSGRIPIDNDEPFPFAIGVEDQALRALRDNEHILFSMAPSSSSKAKAMMATDTTYGMSMDVPASSKAKSRRHRRGNSRGSTGGDDEDPSDGSASLTYSAGSSIASSAAGESTDSSFADIMKVLDVQDSHELAAFMKREGVTDAAQFRKGNKASNVSVASSLAYSTDGESALEGAHLLQTITGQPSDSYGPDGGGFGDAQFGDANILFAPADEPVKSKKSRKDKNRGSPKASRHKRSKSNSSSSGAGGGRGRSSSRTSSSHSRASKGSAERAPPGSNPSTPPPVPRSRSNTEEDEDEVWYAKWWMCGFADSFRDLVPKR